MVQLCACETEERSSPFLTSFLLSLQVFFFLSTWVFFFLLLLSLRAWVEQQEEQAMEEGSSYLEMMGVGEEEDGRHLLCFPPPLSPLPMTSSYSSQMLHFGAFPFHGAPQASSTDSSSISSLSSSSPASITTTRAKPSKKKPESCEGTKAMAAATGPSKKTKTGTIKVRKEKLGERIMALQQLVSPFGKSDTASVLHEAQGYIRFLHDQVQVLSSPYLQRLPSSVHLHDGKGGGTGDLRSRGLCLVPVSCTEHMPNSNGADLWSPAAMGKNGGSGGHPSPASSFNH